MAVSSHQNYVLYKINSQQFLQSFSFFGIRSILLLYLLQKLHLSETEALSLYGNSMAFLYFTPLLGGMLIDKYWSSSTNLLLGVSLISIGLVLMSLPHKEAFFYGLSVLITGQGLFKPVNPYKLDQLCPEATQNRTNVFTTYYVIINVASAIAPFLCSLITQRYGWQASIITCLSASVASFVLIFWRYDTEESIELKNLCICAIFSILLTFIIYYFLSSPQRFDQLILWSTPLVGGYFIYLYKTHPNKHHALYMFLVIVVFCAFVSLFEQAGGAITLFVEKYTNRQIGNIKDIPSPVFLSLNPLLIMIFGVIITRIKSTAPQFAQVTQIAIGFAFVAVGFGFLWVGSLNTSHTDLASSWWVVIGFLFHVLGEICIVPITLSLATLYSPQGQKGTTIGLWYLAAAYGYYLSSWLSTASGSSNVLQTEHFQSVFSNSMIIALCCAVLSYIVMLKKFFYRMVRK